MSNVRLALLLLLLLVSCLPALHALTFDPSGAVLGEQKTVVLLVEFSDAAHSMSSETIHKLIFAEMNRYYIEASFGKVSVAGKETTQWHRLPFASAAYDLAKPTTSDRERIRFATDAVYAADNEVDFKEYARVIILSATTVWPATVRMNVATHDGVIVNRAVIASESISLSALVREYGRLLGLDYLCDQTLFKAGRYPGAYLGSWDPMSNCLGFDEFGRPEKLVHFVAWNKMQLGWIEQSQMVKIKPGGTNLTSLAPLGSGRQGKLLVLIPESSKSYYMIEFREKTGYDTNLYDHGALITYYDGKTPLRVIDQNPMTSYFNDAAFDFRPGRLPVYVNPFTGFSVIVLENKNTLLKLMVSTAEKGKIAGKAERAIAEANSTIAANRDQGKTKGLEEADGFLKLAIDAFTMAKFEETLTLAKQAFEKALGATFPEAYTQAGKLLNQTRTKLEEAGRKPYKSQEAVKLLEKANVFYTQGVDAYEEGDWATALDLAQKAQALIEEAFRKEDEFAKQQETSRFLIISGAAVLLIALAASAIIQRRKKSR